MLHILLGENKRMRGSGRCHRHGHDTEEGPERMPLSEKKGLEGMP